ncbi:hypothetical protein ONZ45_g19495 [Pleurotus djamor]|nr:hypothetical protein ONZ45_g19495 [Pleurotus djamor]
MVQGSKLPYELYPLIIMKLGSPRRNRLYPLLTVSHAFYDIVVPLLYESLIISHNLPSEYDPLRRIYGSCTSVSLTHIPHLIATLQQKPQLAQYTTTLFSETPWAPRLDEILSRLNCLQRLSLDVEDAEDLVFLLNSLPSSVALTHLNIPVFDDDTMGVRTSLGAHSPSLRFLALQHGRGSLPNYLPSALGNLKTLQALHGSNWDFLIGIAPISHMFAFRLSPQEVDRPKSVFANIITLKVNFLQEGLLAEYAPHFKKLRLLYLMSIKSSPDSEVVSDMEVQIEDLMEISSPSLSYIHIDYLGRSSDEFQASSLTPLFDRHLSLRAVDVTHRHSREDYIPTFRYSRESEVPTRADRWPVGMFENWWELLKEELMIDM